MNVGENYKKILVDIAETALKCGRDPAEITLVTVSKGYSWDHVLGAYTVGCRDFGENRVHEALEKMPQAPSDIRWHFIGTLQKNKVRKIVGKFALIHSVDSFELAEKISVVSQKLDLVTPILLEINTSKEPTKHGFTETDCQALFEKMIGLPSLQIQGLMTMAPFIEDERQIRQCFASLRKLKEKLEIYAPLSHLSMGMSHDYKLAIEEGATLLRIGTAITA